MKVEVFIPPWWTPQQASVVLDWLYDIEAAISEYYGNDLVSLTEADLESEHHDEDERQLEFDFGEDSLF